MIERRNMQDKKLKRSKLFPTGIVLMVIGLLLPRQIWQIAESMPDSAIKSLLFISTDLFRLCFFIGLIFLIIGILRNRKLKKIQSSLPKGPPPISK
jgi:uncharacterized membrane protein